MRSHNRRLLPSLAHTAWNRVLTFPYKDFNLYPCDFPAYTL